MLLQWFRINLPLHNAKSWWSMKHCEAVWSLEIQAWNLPTGAKHSWSHRSCTLSTSQAKPDLAKAYGPTMAYVYNLLWKLKTKKRPVRNQSKAKAEAESPWNLAHLDHPSHSQWVLEHLWHKAKFGEKRMQGIYSVNMCEHVLNLRSTVGAPSESDDSDLAEKQVRVTSRKRHMLFRSKTTIIRLSWRLWSSLAEAMDRCDKLWVATWSHCKSVNESQMWRMDVAELEATEATDTMARWLLSERNAPN